MNSDLFTLIRPHYRDLQGYVSAGMETDKSQPRLYMNANENPYELPGVEGYSRYPEPQPKRLLNAYAQTYQVNEDNIVMTRGADEAIVLLTKLFCEPVVDGILIQSPTFGMYGVNARAMPGRVVDVPLLERDGTFALDVANIVNAVNDTSQHLKLVFLCSPNNPTGNAFAQQDMVTICQETAGKAAVVLDETYIEFSGQPSFAQHLNDLNNLIVLRTLSKSYALAGMRMGCLLCGDTDLVELMRSKCLDAYPLPLASVDAAMTVLSPANRQLAAQNRAKLVAERQRLEPLLTAHPLVTHVYPSDSNFLLVKMQQAAAFCDFCFEHGVVLRDFSSKPSTEDCLRISISKPNDNDQLLALLNDFSATVVL